MRKRIFITALFLLLAAIVLGACAPAAESPDATACPTAEACPDCPEAEPCPTCPECEVCEDCDALLQEQVPYIAAWQTSPHNDVESEAFRHWDEDDPAQIPENCAKCHSSYGYQDFLGADGSAFGVVDAPAELGSTVNCVACHNDATTTLTSVVMPSGIEITGLGDEARCMQCHQGRESGLSVQADLEELGLVDDLDTVSEELGFTNIHYYAATATKYGTIAKGGYEYAGKSYDSLFDHAEGYETCIDCHNYHTLEVRLTECQVCHTEAATVEDIPNIRMEGSLVDFDGDGNMEEGIADEIAGLQEMLYQAMQAYSAEVAGSAILYESASYPYFFIDSDGDGAVSEGEAVRDNAFGSWTGRLAKAAYNYQVSLKDGGAYAHGGKYIIQLLYDSIEDLNTQLSSPIDLSAASRIDHGHFAGSEEAFRHWDADGEVEASCARCHSADGLPFEQEHGVQISQELSNGLSCSTCHTSLTEFTIHEIGEVEFPSGATVVLDNTQTGLCLNCHQGRSSTVQVNRALGDQDADTVIEGARFLNVHYFAAGATVYGGDVQGAYEYDGQEYSGFFVHFADNPRQCTDCHNTHQLTVNTPDCEQCHGTTEVEAIRNPETPDYDGDGDVDEGVYGEVQTLNEILYAAMQAYATETVGTGIAYANNYPYFFYDNDGDGVATGAETARDNGFASWTPRLLQAAYNFQYAAKDPGAFAHNPDYIVQVLYDSIANLGQAVTIDMSGMVRPEVTAPPAE